MIFFERYIRILVAMILVIIGAGALNAQVSIAVPTLTLTACPSFPTVADTLNSIVITESFPADINSSGTLVLTTPSTFQFFNPGNVHVNGGDISGISVSLTGNTTIEISFSVLDTLQLDTIVLSGIEIRGIITATSLSPIINTGGTAVIKGDTVGSVHAMLQSTDAPALISSANPAAVCSGNAFNYLPISSVANTAFSWTRAAVNGVSNSSASGNDSISETLIDTLSIPVNVTYTYLLTANGCANATPFNVTLPVNPIPMLTSATSPPTICSGTVLSYTPGSNVTGTTFSWARQAVAGISNAAATGYGNPSELLINTSVTDVLVTYTYTLAANGCTNPSISSVNVNVHPAPSVTNLDSLTICNGTSFTLPLTATISSAFNWFALANIHITGDSISTQHSDTIVNTLYNDTLISENIVYQVIPTDILNNCSGVSKNIVVNVLPTVTMSSDSVFTICSGTKFLLPLTSNLQATFLWQATNNINVSGASLSLQTTDTINNKLVNSLSIPQIVNYNVTPTSVNSGCVGASQQIMVTVNPAPQVVITNADTICSGVKLSTNLAANIPSTYNWFADVNTSLIGYSNILQNSFVINDSIINSTDSLQKLQYHILSIDSLNTCVSDTFSYEVFVNPLPHAVAGNTSSFCSGSVDSIGTASNLGYVYLWSPGTGLNDSTISQPHILLSNSDTVPLIYSYMLSVTEAATGCAGYDTVMVTVNPQPHLIISDPMPICSPATIDITDPIIVAGSSTGVIKNYFADSLATIPLLQPQAITFSDTNYIKIIAVGGCYDIKPVISIVKASPLTEGGNDKNICSGTVDSIGSTALMGCVYRWSPSVGLSDSLVSFPSVTTVNSGVLPIIQKYYVNTTLVSTGCNSIDSVIVTVNPNPVLMVNSPIIRCNHDTINLTDSLITNGSSSGVYSYWQNSLATIPLLHPESISVTDTNFIKLTANGGCSDIKPVVTIINPLPIVSFSGLHTQNCLNASPQILVGSPPGGVFSGNGMVADTFNASIAGVGTQPITYTVTDSNGCSGHSFQFTQILAPQTIKPDMCMVTVNDSSHYNIVYWNKLQYTNADSFIVFRETLPHVYQRLGAVSMDAPGVFADTLLNLFAPYTGNPNDSSYRYKLQILDTCGNYSDTSSFHQTLHVWHSGGTFFWNQYMIETITPPISQLTAYKLLRDDHGLDNWHVVASVSPSVLTATDPDFSAYPSGRWRIQTVWSITCNSGATNSSYSNILGEIVNGIAVNDKPLNSLVIFPNPHENIATLSYTLQTASSVELSIYNSFGQLIVTLLNKSSQTPGKHAIEINTETLGLPKGVYFVKLKINDSSFTKQIIKL